jgi:putative membrane protein
MHRVTRRLALVAGALALTGTTALAQAAGSGVKVKKGEIPPPSASASITAGTTATDSLAARTNVSTGDVVIAPMAPMTLDGWDDRHLAAHLITGDSLEVAISNLALERSQNAQVRDVAQFLVSEHTASMNAQKAMAQKEGYGVETPPSDPSATHLMQVLAKLQTLTGAEFDKVWLEQQLMHHQHELSMNAQLEDKARDNDLEDYIQSLKKPLQTHVDRLTTVATALGVR